MEPTSEQELKTLLDEGKISEDEYRQLLEAIRTKELPLPPVEKPAPQPKPRTGFGKAALILFIIALLTPLVLIALVVIIPSFTPMDYAELMVFIAPVLLIGLLCAVLAFIFGVIGFKSPAGKIAAIGVPCVGLLSVPALLILSLLWFRHTAVVIEEPPLPPGYDNASVPLPLGYHKAFPLDSMEGVLTREGVAFDELISSDGGGSLRIQSASTDKVTVSLIETGPLMVENMILIYSAQLRTENLSGKAYLEMVCNIPGRGEFFSRGLEQSVEGTTDWTTAQTPFTLKPGQRPANARLNLVIEGAGTVWIDDIKLLLALAEL
jgi:hypothetical protein